MSTSRDTDPPPAQGFLAQSGPVELILCILQSCNSTQDLLALVSTCQHVNRVWRGNAAAASWPVWRREIPHFQDAVMAARLTQLVVDAERRRALPPTRLSLRELRQHHRQQQPTLAELRAALGLVRLGHALAACIADRGLTLPRDRTASSARRHRSAEYILPEDAARMPEWTDRVTQTVFRLIVVGAALAGAYKEPLLRALEHPDAEIRGLVGRVPRDFSRAALLGEGGLGRKEMDFLLQFGVCDLDAAPEAQDEVFGPVSEWLLESILSDEEARRAMEDRFCRGVGRAGFCRWRDDHGNKGPCPVGLLDGECGGSHANAHLVVWELMKMLWMVERVQPYPIITGGTLNRRRASPPSEAPCAGADGDGRGPLESAVAVFFGMFQAEETLLTPPADGAPWEFTVTYAAVPETTEPPEEEPAQEKEDPGEGKKLPRGMSVTAFFTYLFEYSGRPNCIDGDWSNMVAPLEFKFFEYFLRRHLGLCLGPKAFHGEDRGGGRTGFLGVVIPRACLHCGHLLP